MGALTVKTEAFRVDVGLLVRRKRLARSIVADAEAQGLAATATVHCWTIRVEVTGHPYDVDAFVSWACLSLYVGPPAYQRAA